MQIWQIENYIEYNLISGEFIYVYYLRPHKFPYFKIKGFLNYTIKMSITNNTLISFRKSYIKHAI